MKLHFGPAKGWMRFIAGTTLDPKKGETLNHCSEHSIKSMFGISGGVWEYYRVGRGNPARWFIGLIRVGETRTVNVAGHEIISDSPNRSS